MDDWRGRCECGDSSIGPTISKGYINEFFFLVFALRGVEKLGPSLFLGPLGLDVIPGLEYE